MQINSPPSHRLIVTGLGLGRPIASLFPPSHRLIVTGIGLGGPIASLFTLSLLDSTDLEKKRLLCITFGSPLVGNKKLQQAISRSSTWSSCFLHVVSYKDPLPKKLKSDTSDYMPCGTFLFCSDTNSTCFENPESVLELLVYSINYTNQGFQPIEYGNIVENLYRKSILKDITPQTQDLTNSSSLHASICLQLWAALGLTPDIQQQQQQNFDLSTLVPKMESLERKFVHQKRKKVDPSRKLNLIKIEMARLEWYKKYSKNRGIGYYDSFKQAVDEDAVQWMKKLTNYWIETVEEAKNKPQKRGSVFFESWLLAGNSYRRMVEPLVIAQYYKNGGKDYVTDYRPKHFVLLEEWFRNEMTRAKESDSEDICELNFEENWDFYTSFVDEHIRSSAGSMVVGESDNNSVLNITSDDGGDEAISSTSFWSRTNQLLLSSKKLNVIEENEENLNTTSESNDKNNSSFEACVDLSLISCQGSVKEENIKKFESHIDEDLLSCLGSMSIDVKELDKIINRMKTKNVEALLTFDSCFWAHVEEALLLYKQLQNVQSSVTESEEAARKLLEFEDYVYGLLKEYEVSPEIFLKDSSYMKWWTQYRGIKGTSYNSALAVFMSNPHHYHQYTVGAYVFS